jgi:hypothetical protein
MTPTDKLWKIRKIFDILNNRFCELYNPLGEVFAWKDRWDVYVLMNMHAPPVEGNFKDESGHAVKPHVIEGYSANIGFVDTSYRMVSSYGIAWRTWNWTKKLFFHLTDMTILNAFLIRKSCGRT